MERIRESSTPLCSTTFFLHQVNRKRDITDFYYDPQIILYQQMWSLKGETLLF